MKSVLYLIALSLVIAFVRGSVIELEDRGNKGYVQKSKGIATFTVYSGCSTPACGRCAYGYTAAMNQLSFGAPGGQGAGDACGRCFKITATEDPYSPWYKGPFKSIVVKVTNLCPYSDGEDWCGQSLAKPHNQFGAPVHFDLCQESGAYEAFFSDGRGALLGNYEEVSCSEWSGHDGPSLWNKSCFAGESAKLWPSTACGNVGVAPPY